MYVLAYQNAIEDVLDMLNDRSDKPERPLALVMAEASVFQGGKPPPAARKHSHAKHDSAATRKADARRRFEELFSGDAK